MFFFAKLSLTLANFRRVCYHKAIVQRCMINFFLSLTIKGVSQLKKIDYEYKAQILRSGLCEKVNRIDRAVYAEYALQSTGEVITTALDYDTANELRCFLLQQDEKAYKEAKKINNARYKRVTRLKLRIADILTTCESPCFLTLTFSDETLESTSADTRRQYVRKYLASYGVPYVANIDYGAKNGREHYHAVIGCPVDLDVWNDKCGFSLSESITPNRWKTVPKKYAHLSPAEQSERMHLDTLARLSKYVAKLTNHAIKETTKRSAVIYYAPNKAH